MPGWELGKAQRPSGFQKHRAELRQGTLFSRKAGWYVAHKDGLCNWGWDGGNCLRVVPRHLQTVTSVTEAQNQHSRWGPEPLQGDLQCLLPTKAVKVVFSLEEFHHSSPKYIVCLSQLLSLLVGPRPPHYLHLYLQGSCTVTISSRLWHYD